MGEDGEGVFGVSKIDELGEDVVVVWKAMGDDLSVDLVDLSEAGGLAQEGEDHVVVSNSVAQKC